MGGVARVVIVAVALGSNLGSRESHLAFAVDRLSGLLTEFHVSSFYETAPLGVSEPQPWFLNAACVGSTRLSAREVLTELLAIERARGRVRPFSGAARTLDLDLVLFGSAVIDEPGLSVPHPRFRERRFVLEPLSEVAATLADPVTGQTVATLLAQLRPGLSERPR